MLFESVASEFVEKAMKLINLNVNIMDSNGKIIASGDKGRIGTLHEGAVLSINRKDMVLVTKEDIKNLQGTKEGVNVPIYCRGVLVGVLGITGDEEKILEYGQLLKMTIELYLENEILVEEQVKHKNLKEKLYIALLKNDLADFNADVVDTYSNRLKLEDYHVVALLKIKEKDFISANMIKGRILKVIDSQCINFSVNLDLDTIAFVVTDKTRTKTKKTTRVIIENIETIVNEKNISIEKIAVGLCYNERIGINSSYRTAMGLLNSKIIENDRVVWVKDHILDVIINSNDSYLEREMLKDLWIKVVDEDKYSELRDTLNTYYHLNCESKVSAEVLNIHRNTLNYRFEKIYNLTGFNPKNKKDLVALIISQSIYLNSN